MGVFQLKNGNWGYRVLVKDENGITKNRRAVRDKKGNVFKTKRSALSAMNELIARFNEKENNKRFNNITLKELYDEYCKYGRNEKAFATNKKHDSMWKNHIEKEFGDKLINEVSVSEVNDFLSELYYSDGYAYKYVESFIKMFYLLFGQAYSRDYLPVEKYNKLCLDKNSKIHMPKLKIDEDLEIKTFDKRQIKLLDDYFKGTNVETAYMLGKYCGLRVGECLGLTWDCIDFNSEVINIEKQMQYQNGVIILVPLKTRNAKRQVVMSKSLKKYLMDLYSQRQVDIEKYRELRQQKEIKIKSTDGKIISSLELVNTLGNGRINTDSALKFHAKNIKKKLDIDFKFHYLRHTFGTTMALLNVPQFLLCKQMGHSKIDTTNRYYLGINKDSIDVLKNGLDSI